MNKRTERWQGMNWIRPAKRLAIYIRDGFKCLYCNRDMRNWSPGELTLDHYIPVARGGDNKETNLATCCRQCNNSKNNAMPEDYLTASELVFIKQQLEQPLNMELAKSLVLGNKKGEVNAETVSAI